MRLNNALLSLSSIRADKAMRTWRKKAIRNSLILKRSLQFAFLH